MKRVKRSHVIVECRAINHYFTNMSNSIKLEKFDVFYADSVTLHMA